MRLICYPTSGNPPKIVAAPVERGWMDWTNQGFAYRCLPLNIANAHGWLLLNTVAFVAQWDCRDRCDRAVHAYRGQPHCWRRQPARFQQGAAAGPLASPSSEPVKELPKSMLHLSSRHSHASGPRVSTSSDRRKRSPGVGISVACPRPRFRGGDELAGGWHSLTHSQKWRKDYFRGSTSFGTAPSDHRTKLKLREFKAAP